MKPRTSGLQENATSRTGSGQETATQRATTPLHPLPACRDANRSDSGLGAELPNKPTSVAGVRQCTSYAPRRKGTFSTPDCLFRSPEERADFPSSGSPRNTIYANTFNYRTCIYRGLPPQIPKKEHAPSNRRRSRLCMRGGTRRHGTRTSLLPAHTRTASAPPL